MRNICYKIEKNLKIHKMLPIEHGMFTVCLSPRSDACIIEKHIDQILRKGQKLEKSPSSLKKPGTALDNPEIVDLSMKVSLRGNFFLNFQIYSLSRRYLDISNS